MDRPLHIGNVHNVSMESLTDNNEDPHLVAQFTCDAAATNCVRMLYTYTYSQVDVCCAAVYVHNVYNATFKGIDITVQNPNMSGVAFVNVSSINVQLDTACSLSSPPSQKDFRIGIMIYKANFFEMHLSSANNCSRGLEVHSTNNCHISNTTAMYNYPYNGTVTSPSDIGGVGMSFFATNNTAVINPIVMYNYLEGMLLFDTVNVTTINTTTMYNGAGMFLKYCIDITTINTTAMYNDLEGMYLNVSFNVTIINTMAMHNIYGGIISLNIINITIINTNASQNGARGHGVDLWHTIDCTVINTTASQNGYDGIYLQDTINSTIINTTAVQNGAHGIELWGTADTNFNNTTVAYNHESGISSYDTRANTVIINLAVVGNGNKGILLYKTFKIHIAKVSLMHNGWKREVTTLNGDVLSTADPTTLPAVIVLFYSSLHVSGCNVTRNNISAIKMYASTLETSGEVKISNNRAIAGTAFILVQNSILKLAQKADVQIMNNHALNTGGVFHITSDLHYSMLRVKIDILVTSSSCFFNTEGSRSQSRFTFVNNSAGKGGDILYGGHVLYGLDGDWNCLLSFKNISNISQSGLSLITSDPSRVCLCNGTGQPDCLIVADPTPHSIYPGQSINISAVVVGQDFGTVSGSVYAQFLQKLGNDYSPQLGTEQEIQDITQEKCSHIDYTIYSPGDMSEAVLILKTDSRRVSQFVTYTEFEGYRELALQKLYNVNDVSSLNPLKYGHSPVYVNLSFLPCPTGFMLTTKPPFKCDCNHLLQQLQGVKCYIQDQTIGRSGLIWLGTLKEGNGTVFTISEYCIFDYCNKEDSNVTLSDPDSQCNYNHSGTLCGGCQPGLSLALGSAQCLPCSNKYLALLIPFALAGPAVVFFIKLLDLTISQGTINGLIFYVNIVKANEYIFLPQGKTNPVTLFIAWLNLDLGVETCFFHGLTVYTKTWLQFVFPLYIWSIAGLIIILAKYSDRVARVMGNNSVPVLATIILLSYAKLLRTFIAALSYTLLYSSQGHKAVWSADGNVDYLGPKHAPLFAVAVAALLFLWLPYTLLLFLGQWLHRCNCRLIVRLLVKMKPFLDAHYGSLKGKHYYWFGALLIVRAIILLISALIPTNHANIVNFCISVSAIVLMYLGLIVHSNIIVALFDMSFFMNLGLLGVTNLFIIRSKGDQEVAVYTLIGMAFAQLLVLVIFKVFSICKRSEKVIACLHKRRPAEDNWELYEEAALLREMESDTEEEGSDVSGSIESLPTY